jgi:heat shock protein 5
MLSFFTFLSTFRTHLVSVQRGGRVEIIANDQGHRITPSWVSFAENERLQVQFSVLLPVAHLF